MTPMIDLRTDTVTNPRRDARSNGTRGTGDDGYGEDPTVNRLEELAAEKLGKDAACL